MKIEGTAEEVHEYVRIAAKEMAFEPPPATCPRGGFEYVSESVSKSVSEFVPEPAESKYFLRIQMIRKIISFLENDEKVSAVKEYKAFYNVGLKASSDAVNLLKDALLAFPR